MISETERKLMKRIKSIWSDRNSVCGVKSGLRQADKVYKMLDFLLIAEKRGEKYTPDQIMALTIALRKQGNKNGFTKGAVALSVENASASFCFPTHVVYRRKERI